MRRIALHWMLSGLLACLMFPPNVGCRTGLPLQAASLAKTEARLRRAIARHPYDSQLHYELARVLAEQKKWDGAIPEYEAVLSLDPANVRAYLGLGEAFDQVGDPARAIHSFTEATAVDPQNFEGHLNLCRSLPRKHMLAEALGECGQAVRLRPSSADAHVWLGMVHIQRQAFDEAVKEFEFALKLEPRSPWAHAGTGQALHMQGHFSEAIPKYSEALAMDPDLPYVKACLGLAYVNRAEEEKGPHRETDLRNAASRAQEALRSGSDLPLAHFTLGLAALLEGADGTALAEFRTALDQDPEYTDARINVGVILLNIKKDARGALAEFRSAARIAPTNALAHLYLAVALKKTQDLDGAVKEYQEALRLDPSLREARDGMERAIKQRDLLRDAPDSGD